MREGIVRRKRVLWLRGDPGTSVVVREPAGGNLHLPADPDPVLYIGPQDGPEGAGVGGAAGGDGGGRAGGAGEGTGGRMAGEGCRKRGFTKNEARWTQMEVLKFCRRICGV